MASQSQNDSMVSVPLGNRLLKQLTADERDRLIPRLEYLPLKLNEVMFSPGVPIPFCWFPLSGVISMTSEMENGDSAKVGVVGNEGYVGMPIVLGMDHAEYRSFVQVPGDALRISSADMRVALTEIPALRNILLRDTNAQLSAIAQCAACNALHTAEERLSRWLLMLRDRISGDTLPITHELLGMMLGTRRSTVTVVAGILERAGLILQSRGHIQILKPAQLEMAACECYARIRSSETRVER